MDDMLQLINSKYKIKELVHEDILAFSYKGEMLSRAQSVVIMKYKPEYLSHKIVNKMIKALEKVMMLKHPVLREICDYYYDGKYFYVVYEDDASYISLETLLEQNKTITVNQLWSICTQVLAGLKYFESQGIYHGNLNFRSIYLTKENKVKLAKVFVPIHILQEHFSKFLIFEDCIFYSPEFLQKQVYSSQSDMYAFGVLLFSCFSGQWPLKYSHNINEIKKELIKQFVPFKKRSETIPDRLGVIIEICLRKNSQHRFNSFSELILAYKGEDTRALRDKSYDACLVENEIETTLESFSKKKRQGVIKSITFLSFIVIGMAFIYMLYMNYLTEIPSVVIPDLTQKTSDEAEQIFEKLGLDYDIGGEFFHPTIEKGLIISTKPRSGREVKANRLVKVFISKGEAQLLVPDLVGRTVEESKKLLGESHDLFVVGDQAYSKEYQSGYIISQTPTSNSFLAASQNIEVVISQGYPVSMSVRSAKSLFFGEKENLRRVSLSFSTLDGWEPQIITILVKNATAQEKIFSRKYNQNSRDQVSYELNLNDYIEVYFNDELALKQQIIDTVVEDDTPNEREERND